MNVTEAIRARRSVRKFKQGIAIPEEHIHAMLEAAMMAPSALNTRPWEFFVVKDRNIMQELLKAHPACRLETASLGIVVCGRPDLQEGRGYWPQDCGAAIENILLQALDYGYGTCWCGCYPTQPRTDDVQKVLGTQAVPVAIVAIGVPDESPAAKGFYDESRLNIL